MKFVKAIGSLVIAAAMVVSVLTFSACHKKDEAVMTINGTDIPSGLYLAIQYSAYSEFIGDVYEDVGSTASISKYADYASYTHPDDGTEMIQWISDRTAVLCKQYAAVKQLMADNDLALTVSEKSYATQYAKYYWENSLQALYENSGVSYDSYEKAMLFQTELNKLFNFYYDKADDTVPGSGSKAVPEDEINTQLNADYILADSLTMPLTSSEYDEDGNLVAMTDEEKAARRTKLEAYANRINAGESFDAIKTSFETDYPTEAASAAAASSAATSSTTSIYPQSAAVYTATDSDTTNWDAFSAVKSKEGFSYSKAYVSGEDTDSSLQLVVLYDLSTDDYYKDQYRSTVLNTLKFDEFEQFLADTAAGYTFNENSGLLKFYSASKIDFDAAASKANAAK